jgi:hypothetical protein
MKPLFASIYSHEFNYSEHYLSTIALQAIKKAATNSSVLLLSTTSFSHLGFLKNVDDEYPQ